MSSAVAASGAVDLMTAAPGGFVPASGPAPDETSSLADVGGMEIAGIDLAQPLSPARRERIVQSFRTHPILVFRDQHLTKDQQHAFTLNFGEIEDQHVNRLVDSARYAAVHTVSNLDRDGHPSSRLEERGNYFWHTDKSYHAIPSLLTMLHAVELPGMGGETQFANMAMAYAALPEAVRQQIAGLRAVHSWEASRRNSGSRLATEAQQRERPPVTHPVVCSHPDTGAKALYLGNHVSHIEGMPAVESRDLIARLMAHAMQPRFVYSHRWREGDLVLWDNRCLLHRALANYPMGSARRILHRTVVRGA
ncbi:MAG: TauD/TfdA family dioxygenase [Acetobacteraceae bacterium]|jgi:taurine dioxygenase